MADDVQEEPLPVPAQDEPDTAPPVQLSVKRSGGGTKTVGAVSAALMPERRAMIFIPMQTTIAAEI